MLTSLRALLRLAVLQRLGVFICALATLLAAANTASALEPAQTKTRVWGFDFAADNSSGLFRAASSGKHQGNRLAGAEVASGSLLAARGAAVLGRGSTANIAKGTTLARNLRESMAIKESMANPAAGRELRNLVMSDSPWPASEGWVKMQQMVNSGGREGPINVHYLLNQASGAIDDFKIVLSGAR